MDSLAASCTPLALLQTYMLPEGSGDGTLRLYRAEAEGFPLRWKRQGTPLLQGVWADSTLFEWGGRWWMFTSPFVGGAGPEGGCKGGGQVNVPLASSLRLPTACKTGLLRVARCQAELRHPPPGGRQPACPPLAAAPSAAARRRPES